MTSFDIFHVNLNYLSRLLPEDAHAPRTVIDSQVRGHDRVRPPTARKSIGVLQHREVPEVLAQHVWPARLAKVPHAAEHIGVSKDKDDAKGRKRES